MFIMVCGWIFVVAILLGLTSFAAYVIMKSKNTSFLIPYDIKQPNGAVAHEVDGTWYGWSWPEMHKHKIIPRRAIPLWYHHNFSISLGLHCGCLRAIMGLSGRERKGKQ